MNEPFFDRSRRRTYGMWIAALAPGCCLLLYAARLLAQAGPDSDPVPLIILMNKLDHGQQADAERLIKDNLAVTKKRLDELIDDRDSKFDELGRFGATSGHEVHKEVLDAFMEENKHYTKVFDLYRQVSGDPIPSERFEARRLRYEGAFYTHDGEDICGNTLNWEEAQKQYRTALDRLDAAFALAKKVNDLRLMASTKINIGSTLIRLVDADKAMEAYNEGMRYADQVPGELYRGLVRLNMGNTYVWILQPNQSLTYAQSALASFKKMGRGTWEANALMVIGNAQMEQKNYSSSWETLRQALDLAVQSGEDRVRGKAFLNLANLSLALKRNEDAANYFKQAMDWFVSHGDVYTAIERETVRQDGLLALRRLAEEGGDQALADKYKKEFFDSLGDNPERYQQIRSSPCYALYKANPSNKQQAQRTP
jgi:tetratricopeptide (TPR) repeat protein